MTSGSAWGFQGQKRAREDTREHEKVRHVMLHMGREAVHHGGTHGPRELSSGTRQQGGEDALHQRRQPGEHPFTLDERVLGICASAAYRIAEPPPRSEQKRLQGVYSKLQTVKLFSSGEFKQQRFLLLDADMLMRTNIDDVFSTNVTAAVMRGEADSCLFERRPGHTYFRHNMVQQRGDSHKSMKGGLNGGMVWFQPDSQVYEDMKNELCNFRPHSRMAEQEFLSWYWGRNGRWHAIHKKIQLPDPPAVLYSSQRTRGPKKAQYVHPNGRSPRGNQSVMKHEEQEAGW